MQVINATGHYSLGASIDNIKKDCDLYIYGANKEQKAEIEIISIRFKCNDSSSSDNGNYLRIYDGWKKGNFTILPIYNTYDEIEKHIYPMCKRKNTPIKLSDSIGQIEYRIEGKDWNNDFEFKVRFVDP